MFFRQHFAPPKRLMGEAAISKDRADMRKGTPAMAEELYTDFYDQLLGWCTARVRSPAAAEDLVQETFLRAMDHLEDLEPLNRAQRRAWLYRTAKNLAVDRVRRQARETPAEEEQLALLSSDGMLVKRPLVVADGFVLTGFKEKEWEEKDW